MNFNRTKVTLCIHEIAPRIDPQKQERELTRCPIEHENDTQLSSIIAGSHVALRGSRGGHDATVWLNELVYRHQRRKFL
jgi:hypothetical protein